MFKVEAIEMAQSFSRGEEKGFKYFFDTLYPALKYYAFRITNDVPSAEDVVENSFIKIWERRESFTHHLVIKSWLYTTVRNECLNRFKAQGRIEEFDPSYNDEFIHASIDENLIRAEVYSELYQSIELLPTECKRILKLIFFNAMPVKEISEHLKISISTVKNQKARGLLLLRKRYGISGETLKEKHLRWVKAIYNSLGKDNARTARLYGISTSLVHTIRIGKTYPKITKNL